jgi:hypothetical protein
MVDLAEDSAMNFQSSLPVIFVWHLLLSAVMMSGGVVGQRLCSIALQAMERLMAMLSAISYLQRSGIVMKIQLQVLIG